jgi:sRNA-binding regulator protein Hfq
MYKHGISTVVPSRPIKFAFDQADDSEKAPGNE